MDAQINTFASNVNGSASDSAEIDGLVSGSALTAQAEASRAGTWTATWKPTSAGAWPTLIAITHDQSSQYVSSVSNVTGTSTVTSADGAVNVTATFPIIDSPIIAQPTTNENWDITDLTCPILTTISSQDSRNAVNSDSGTAIGWMRFFSTDIIETRYYTQAYVQAHFATPNAIVIYISVAPIDTTSSVSVTAASDPSAYASASAESLDNVTGK